VPAANDAIRIRGARQHNLKGLDLEIPRGKITVVTGPSGSGKSSLAFHTLYAEGQRRYVETFSPYVRQFFDRMDKPAVDHIDGIPPAIAIEQKNNVRTTRSTVGTITEINDYLKLLFPRVALGHDPHTGAVIQPDSPESAANWTQKNLRSQAVLVTFPIPVPPNTPAAELFGLLHQQGYLRVLLGDAVLRTDEPPADLALPKSLGALQVIQDRLTVNSNNSARLREALEAAFALGKGRAEVRPAAEPNNGRSFSTAWINPETGFTLRKPTPALFSFNNPLGACPQCRGFGRVIGLDLDKAVPNPRLTLKQGAIKPFLGERGGECQTDLLRNCRERRIDVNTRWIDLDQETRDWVYYGDRKANRPLDPEALEELWQSGAWYGVKGFFDWLETKSYKMHVRIFLARYRSYTTCPSCRGQRLQPDALCFKIAGMSLPDLWALPVNDLREWFASLSLPASADPTLKLILTEITNRLAYLDEVGLGYLTLDRTTRTLSGGEVERVNLTTCLGASLTNTLFVLDEPTVGLHPRDIARLTGIMRSLCDKGNTLVVVEHEEAVMRAADELLDIGPGAGQHGGEIVYQGSLEKFARGSAKRKTALEKLGTLPWLTGEKFIPVPTGRRPPDKRKLSIKGATRHNLRNLDADIPLGLFVCLTGVSGSGKSTFVHDVLFLNLARRLGIEIEDEPALIDELDGAELLSGVQLVDQSPLARTPRSTPAVFLGAFDPLRQLFCESDAAKSASLTPGFFSFNSGEGRCDRCAGNGFEKIEMQFLSDLYVTCPDCNGRRYKPSTLDYTYLDRSVADFLDLTVDEAVAEFAARQAAAAGKERTLLGKILTALQPLIETGLGYLRLGQPLNTLSGGESQRLKLCQLLAGTLTGDQDPQLLILDEPTTGLHFSDIARLLTVFQRLVDAGHSLLVIEHNLDVIKSADWILDLGPEAGIHGGQLVAQGTPEQVALTDTPTARFLAPLLPATKALRAAEEPAAYRTRATRAPAPADNAIAIRGARHHNLKNLTLDIPRDKLVVVTGLSGSGKSTLAFDIIFAEGQRRFLDSMSPYARQFAEQLEKPDVDLIAGLPPTVAIEQRVSQGGGKSTVATITEVWHFLRLLYAKTGTQYCPDCQVPVEKQSLTAIEAAIRGHLARGPVSILAPVIRARKGFHTDVAEWAARQGFTRLLVDKKFMPVDGFQRLERFKEHDIDVVVGEVAGAEKSAMLELPALIARALKIGKNTLRILTPEKKFVVLSAAMSCPNCARSFDELDPRLFSFNSPHGWCPNCRGHGMVAKRHRGLDVTKFDSVLAAEVDADRALDRAEDCELVPCKECDGTRLHPIGRAVRLQGTPIAALANISVDAAAMAVEKFSFSARDAMIARDILPEIGQRLRFLSEVGLGYLQLNRSARTLSGGEAQRIRLAAQLGSNLRGVLYVLDEPTIGLHPRDNVSLLDTLQALLAKGNSLLVVEHDEDTMARADYLLDLGPGAGRLGGEVMAAGTLSELMANPASVTGRALSRPVNHPSRGERRPIPAPNATEGWLRLQGCSSNNLKNLNARIPLGRLTVLTGVSGSGKSSLMRGAIAAIFDPTKKRKPYKAVSGQAGLNACYEVDQSPIGKTSRSCPATYVKVFDEIRTTFAQLPEARLRGFDASRFSFNTDGGRCPDCKGNGRVKLEMDFLPTTWVPCETCDEDRYNPATLSITYDGRSIGDVLHMTIDEAASFFTAHPKISRPLQLLADTGLGYLQLGQPSPTLSGGEAQRLKLVSQLIRGRSAKARLTPNAPANLYLIEEPTIGLHLDDVAKLIDVLHRLVDEGHTVIVIEHHTAVMAEADYLIDIGPEAGAHGGTIVAQGTPEKVATSEDSRTAPFLRKLLA